MSKGLDTPIKSTVLGEGDKVIQIMVNERWDVFALLKSGRIFKARARGHSGAYAPWEEIDFLDQIKRDLKI